MWLRSLQIGIGIIAIGLSLSAIIYPIYAVVATFVAAGIILFLFGIEQIVSGIFLYASSRISHIAFGAFLILLAGLVIAYPVGIATFLVLVVAFGVLIAGITSIVSGLWAKNKRNQVSAGKGSRTLSIAAGALAVALSIAIMVSPSFGVNLAGILIGIALLAGGIRLVITGISGRRHAVAGAADSMAA